MMLDSCGQDGFTFTLFAALLSLGWFLLGILMGRRLGRKPASAVSARPSGGGRRDDVAAPARKGSVELYVGNLPYDMGEPDLEKTFAKFGKVESTRIIAKKADGQSRGYGFVTMVDRNGAEAAIEGMHGKEVSGRTLVVNEARTRGKSRR